MNLYHIVQRPIIELDKNPALILLHGYGSNEEDLFSFASELPKEYFIISVRAPYMLQQGSYAWYAINFDADEKKFSDLEQATKSRDIIIEFMEKCIKEYPIDKDNISLIGFSQGAILSYAIGISYPEKIRKIVVMSGYFNSEIAVSGYATNNFSNFEVFASHGTVDQVVPIEWARKAKPILEGLHIKNVYKEYPIGHGISPQNFYDFKKWLENS
jgi:phospholipase/carboxylesterase